jgi:hypothetical protein
MLRLGQGGVFADIVLMPQPTNLFDKRRIGPMTLILQTRRHMLKSTAATIGSSFAC